ALLQLARGAVEGAVAAVRRSLPERAGGSRPAPLLAAVEVLRAAGAVAGARAAAAELGAAASRPPSEVLGAMAAHAAGSVLVAEGDAVAGLGRLREAASAWRALRMPYEAARTGVLVGVACAALGDRATADLELANAGEAFAALGAV